jgi:hypothetical protein
VYIINNWKILRHELDGGVVIICLYGEVFGNPRFKSGGPISTSAIESYRAKTDSVVTVSGSEYQLGKPDPAAPFARQRLIRYLVENGKPTQPGEGSFINTGEQTNIGGKEE